MKKYGLQLRVQPQEKKRPNPPVSNPIFGDDDDDNVEREILRQAYKNKAHKDVEEQQKKALEEDPSVFDYDGVYDKMKEKQIRPIQEERQERKPKYIQKLIDKAKQREKEHEIIYERKLAKERSKDEHLYGDKDKYVTSAYKKKLAEQAKWLQEEKLREMREEKEDVTKKTDLTDFYFNLSNNVAFGAEESSRKRKKQPEEPAAKPQQEITAPPPVIPRPEPVKNDLVVEADDRDDDAKVRASGDDDQGSDEPSASNQAETNEETQSDVAPATAPKDFHRKSEDALAAAKERFLARKKAKNA